MRLLFVIIFFTAAIFAQFQNVQVNHPESLTPNEVSIAINPVQPNQIAAGANIDYFYFTEDFGRSWSESELSSSLGVWGDPCLLFDNDNNIYFAHLSNPQNGTWIDRIVVQKSSNKGVIWNNGAGVGLRAPRKQDKEWMAVDRTDSDYRNSLYMAWTEFDQYGSGEPSCSSRIRFSRSVDGGVNWSEPLTLSDVEGNCIDGSETVEGAVPAVGPNGEIYISWSGHEKIYFTKSLNGGITFDDSRIIGEQPFGWAFDVPGVNRCNGFPVTACDVSDSPYKGRVYIMWSDQRNGFDNTDIFLMHSDNGGDTWSDAVRVNTDNTQRHQFFPWMAIDQTNGNLYFVFYDRRNTIGTETDVYIARSADGGETFTNHKVSEESFVGEADIFFGDYTNIDAHDGKIYPIWMRRDEDNIGLPILSIYVALVNDEGLITAVDNEPVVISDYRLMQNYPNPFNPSTVISYSIPKASDVKLTVYDILGNTISTLVNKTQSPGVYEVDFNSGTLASGVYMYKLTAGDYTELRKMVLLK